MVTLLGFVATMAFVILVGPMLPLPSTLPPVLIFLAFAALVLRQKS
jgi:hypothetical protein